MSAAAFALSYRSADGVSFLRYAAADGNAMEFQCRPDIAPMPVWVPRGMFWDASAPSWARSRRETIVADLRSAGALIYATDQDDQHATLTRVVAPDGRFRLEYRSVPDDRAAAWESTRLIATTGDEVLLDLPLHSVDRLADFSIPGEVGLSLVSRYGVLHAVRIDVAARAFRFDNETVARPLNTLEPLLRPVALATPAPFVSPRRGFDGLMNVVGLLFVVAGLWVLVAGNTVSDRFAGFLGVVLGVASAYDLLRKAMRTSQRAVPSWWAYLPLVAVLAQGLWLGVLFVGFLFLVGDKPYVYTPGSPGVRFMGLLGALPSLAGLVIAAWCLLRRAARTPLQWLCLGVGTFGVVAYLLKFGFHVFGR